jgi:hypothetical protein
MHVKKIQSKTAPAPHTMTLPECNRPAISAPSDLVLIPKVRAEVSLSRAPHFSHFEEKNFK